MMAQTLQASYENRWDDALRMLDEARPLIVENYGTIHGRYIELESLYGSFWQGKGRQQEALKHFSLAFQSIQFIFNENFKYLSFSEREKFVRSFEYYQSLFYDFARNNIDLAEVQCFAYDLTLFRKELLTGYDRQLMNAQTVATDSLSTQYRVLSQMIAKQQTLPVKQRVELLDYNEKVPDAQTRAFMDVFYQQLMDKNNVHVAFSAAQNAMRKQFQTPYYWAGFILIE